MNLRSEKITCELREVKLSIGGTVVFLDIKGVSSPPYTLAKKLIRRFTSKHPYGFSSFQELAPGEWAATY